MHESAVWRCRIQVAKFEGLWAPDKEPYEVIDIDGNMLVYGGVSALWHRLIGGTGVDAFSSNNAAIGVGDSSTAESATQTDLLGANRARKGMDPGFPVHTDSTAIASNTVQFRATFDPAEANFEWHEIGVFNNPTLGQGRMLNRRVQDMGEKTSAASWQVTVEITLE